MRRRRLLAAAPALLAGCATRPAATSRGPAAAPAAALPAGAGLHARAAARGLAFGAAVTSDQLAEPDFVAALRAECGLLVAEWEHKWSALEPRRGARDFSRADRVVAFARRNGMALRGHALLWHESEPAWLPVLPESDVPVAMAEHIAATAGRWQGAVGTWDVVNEAVHPGGGRPDFLRRTPLLERLGPDHIATAYRLAAQADPGARLAYNDFGCEPATREGRRMRRGVLGLLRGLKSAGVPVHVLGMQGHLHAHEPFEPGEWRDFLAEVASLGLTIEVTELDLNDRALPAEIARRDALAAQQVHRFLDATLAEPAVRSIVTWGLSDRHSWVHGSAPAEWRRSDRLRSRPLPLDEVMRRKPMWQAIAAAFDAAPPRPAARA